MNRMKQWTAVCLAGLLAFSLAVLPASAASNPQVDQAVLKAKTYVQNKMKEKGTAAIDDWTLIALSLLGEEIQSARWGGSKRWEAELTSRLHALDLRKTTDFARFIVTITAAGEDPARFGGTNLIERIKRVQLANGKFADSMDGSGQTLVNAHVWSIIALYAAGEQIPRGKQAKAWLVSKQLPDGGFQFAADAKTSGIDMTAMALVAFRALGASKEEAPVQKALAYLKKQQRDGGGYAEAGVPNAESAANVLSALIAWGEDPRSWSKGNGNVLGNLLSFQKADGSFSHTRNGPANTIATGQAMLGLSDAKRGRPYAIELHEKSGNRKMNQLQDLPKTHWAYSEISYLVKNGYLQGVSSTQMKPNQAVTRAEFAALLLRAVGEVPIVSPKGIYEDVSRQHWSAGTVEKVAALGFMQGSHKRFRPNQGITHEEMATILDRVSDTYGWQKTYAKGTAVSINVNQVSGWAKASVQALQKRKLLGATANKQFSPKAGVTRAEAAAILYRLLMTR